MSITLLDILKRNIEDTKKYISGAQAGSAVKDGDGNNIVDASRTLKKNKNYVVGDIAYSPLLPTWLYLVCIQKGNSGDLSKFDGRTAVTTTSDTTTTTTYRDPAPDDTFTIGDAIFKVRSITKISNFENDAKYLQTVDILDKIYPVGSIYMSMASTDPATLFGGTWSRISQGRMLLGADDSTYEAGATGGEATHTLSVNEMPTHTHSGSTSWADLQGNLWNSNNDSITCSSDVGTSGIFSRGNGWGHFGGQASGDNVTTSLYVNASHNHSLSIDSTGGGQAHNNMPPYLVCYIWQRTA